MADSRASAPKALADVIDIASRRPPKSIVQEAIEQLLAQARRLEDAT
jgi:hypothetical protein